MSVISIISIIAAVLCGAVVFLLLYSSRRLSEKDAALAAREAELSAVRMELAGKEAEIRAADLMRSREAELHEKTVADLKAAQAQAIEAAKTSFALENEKILKAREEALKKQAEETMKSITGGLDKDIRDMREAFDAQKKTHAEESSAIRTKFEETVKNLRSQTEAIGTQAVDLANALKGRNKMQGIFGETILENILQAEGLRKGHDYDSEYWLRDKRYHIIQNEETGRRMRPDFALHFPDNTDILIDSKVSLTALSDYFSAQSDDQRADASRRNLQSVLDHISELSGKEYQKFVSGARTLDYVIMFIPNYGAYQLAKQEDSDIFTRAFRQNVLITTEETLIPFLRLIRSAWVQKEQIENMENIVSGARKMLDRVAVFCKEQAKVEASLEKALDDLRANGKRLVDSRQSIAGAAREVVECGVSLSSGKELPENGVTLNPEI